ncbi:MAG TPA: glycosyltransferase [Pirellulales bacterium]|nr:glycosyltransferase [Pirellulales bacterium]
MTATRSGRFVAALADWLQAQEHEVRTLVADGPWFVAAGDHPAFDSLDDNQVTAHRDEQRALMDREIDDFDPHVVHAQHVWIHGHLALEAGVPYVITAWGDELDVLAADSRWRRLAQETAENAGRIFVGDASLQARVRTAFGEVPAQVSVLDCPIPVIPACGRQLVAAYREVHVARFGKERP